MAILKGLKINAYVSGHVRDMVYNSKAQLVQSADQQKGTKKVTWAIYWQDEKKLEKVLESWNWTIHIWQY